MLHNDLLDLKKLGGAEVLHVGTEPGLFHGTLYDNLIFGVADGGTHVKGDFLKLWLPVEVWTCAWKMEVLPQHMKGCSDVCNIWMAREQFIQNFLQCGSILIQEQDMKVIHGNSWETLVLRQPQVCMVRMRTPSAWSTFANCWPYHRKRNPAVRELTSLPIPRTPCYVDVNVCMCLHEVIFSKFGRFAFEQSNVKLSPNPGTGRRFWRCWMCQTSSAGIRPCEVSLAVPAVGFQRPATLPVAGLVPHAAS